MVKKSKAKAKKKPKNRTKSTTRKAKSVRKARKVAVKKATGKKPRVAHGDKRVPIPGDPNYEMLCKWSTANNEYICKEVPIGGDWRQAKKAVGKKAVAIKPMAMTRAAGASHPDRRIPIPNSSDELLCKWDTGDNEYICKEVPIG